MRIKGYPGRAIDVNLSLEENNSMGVLYEANWSNAHENLVQQKMANDEPNGRLQNESSLGRYQRTLDMINAKEAENKDVSRTQIIKNIGGYKPTTLRKIKRRQFSEWEQIDENTQISESKNNESQTTEYNNINQSVTAMEKNKKAPNLRRWNTTMGKHDDRPKITNYREVLQSENCDKTLKNKKNYSFSDSFSENRKLNHHYETIDCDNKLKTNRNGKTFDNELNGLRTLEVNDRMNSYKMSNNFCSEVYKRENVKHIPKSSATLSRNKSIKGKPILDEIPIDLLPRLEINKTTEKDKITGFGKMLYNTISAGTKFPRIFLKNSLNKSIEEETDPRKIESPSSASTAALQSSKSSKSSPRSIISEEPKISRYSKASISSTDSDSFAIPRPRLIVPVHTYARKRRTGNLVNEKNIDPIYENIGDKKKTGKNNDKKK